MTRVTTRAAQRGGLYQTLYEHQFSLDGRAGRMAAEPAVAG